MSLAPRLISGEKRGEDADRTLRPQSLDEFVGQAAARANLKVFVEAAKHRGEALDHVLFVGPARARQDDAGADHGARARGQFPLHLRPGHRQGGRPGRAAHQSRGARRALHRRDPPAQPGGRGDPLSGDGGLPARPDHRRGTGGALGEDRPRQVHAGGGNDAARPDHQSAARPVRHSRAAQFLHASRSWSRSCAAAPASLACRSATRARWRSRGGHAARRASPGGCSGGCAISRRWRGPARCRAASPTRRCPAWRSTRWGSTSSTAAT